MADPVTDNQPVTSPLLMDRGARLGNSEGRSGRRALHVKIDNLDAEPIKVELVQSSGDEIHDSKDTSVAGSGVDNHDYTVPVNKVFEFEGILGSASGLIKVEIQFSLDGLAFSEIGARFNDRPPGIDCSFRTKNIPAGGKVRLIRTNRQNQAFNVSTTILGVLKDA